jgi:rhamnogalacturonan endolyase
MFKQTRKIDGKRSLFFVAILVLAAATGTIVNNSNTVMGNATPAGNGRAMENLGRGIVALNIGGGRVYVSWRMLRTDPVDIAFNLYRKSGEGDPVKVNDAPIVNTTDFVDDDVDTSKNNTYFVRPVINGTEGAPSASFTLPADAPVCNYISIPLRTDIPSGARHVGVGDLDGDGEYDFVVKRGDQDIDPSQHTVPTETYKLEAYKRDGTFLWRVDLGKNIRPGVWYSPFIVYDLDGDGKAEVAAKIGENEEDWNGDGRTDYTDSEGRALEGPEYFVILDGMTGRILARENWIERGNVSEWGDNYGNRVDRHLMAVAYLCGCLPSLIIARGTYTKIYVEAWNWRNGLLTKAWRWYKPSGGGGFHNVRIGDVDDDGKDEVIYGSIAIDNDGTTMWITGEGHGDRMHMTDIDPTRPGKEIWYVQERSPNFGVHLRDARTGELIWGKSGQGFSDVDIGRGLAADIDPRHEGLECWASVGDLYNAKGETIGARPSKCNFAIWWDEDLLREHLDGTNIAKWDYNQSKLVNIFTASECAVGSRSAPMGYGDILGDWREEVWYVADKKELRIYVTTIPAVTRLCTLMHDSDYRTSVACETMGYMQATQPSFYLPFPPVASFTYSPSTPTVDGTVTFNASASYDPNGIIVGYRWDFGDGQNATGTTPNVTHVYAAPGIYTVNLTVIDNCGLTNSTAKSITVGKISSIITVNVDPAIVTVGSNVTVTGTLTPTRAGVNVTIYYCRLAGETWTLLATVETDSNGDYAHTWTTMETGTYEVKANWTGDANTLPAESAEKTVKVEEPPLNIIPYATAGVAVTMIVAIFIYLVKIRKH